MPHLLKYIVFILVAVIMPMADANDEPYELTLGTCPAHPSQIKRNDICIEKNAEDQWLRKGDNATFYWAIVLPKKLGKSLNESKQNISVKIDAGYIVQGTKFTSILSNRNNWHASIKLTPIYLYSLLNITLSVNQAQYSDQIIAHLEIKVGDKYIWKTGPVHISVKSPDSTNSPAATVPPLSMTSNNPEMETSTSMTDFEATSGTVPQENLPCCNCESQPESKWDIWGLYILITVTAFIPIVYGERNWILRQIRRILAGNPDGRGNSSRENSPGDSAKTRVATRSPTSLQADTRSSPSPTESQSCTLQMEPGNTAPCDTVAAGTQSSVDHETQTYLPEEHTKNPNMKERELEHPEEEDSPTVEPRNPLPADQENDTPETSSSYQSGTRDQEQMFVLELDTMSAVKYQSGKNRSLSYLEDKNNSAKYQAVPREEYQ